MLSATNFAWRFKGYLPFYHVPSIQFKPTLRAPITTAAEKKILFIYLFHLFILFFFHRINS